MIDKFIKNELSEREEDLLMKQFFEEKEKEEFRNKWKNIIRDENQNNKPKTISIFRSHFYKIAAAASIVLFFGIYNIKFNDKYSEKINYSATSKGDKNIIINKIISKYDFNAYSKSSNISKVLVEKYNLNNYDVVVGIVGETLNKDSIPTNENIWLAAVSAIKMNEIEKAKQFLIKLKNDSKYSKDSQKLLKLLNN
jgi:hypothetical protein